MAAVERRHGGASSDDEHCGYRGHYDDEGNKGKRNHSICMRICLLLVPGGKSFLAELQLDPHRAIKRFCCKLFFYLWCVAVAISILSLLGFKVNPFHNTGRLSTVTSDGSSVHRNQDSSDSGVFGNILGDVFSTEEIKSGENDQEAKKDDDEVIPEQVIAAPIKEGNKLNKKLERKLACEEVECIDACNKKIKPKCAKSRGCRNDRDKICHRRCRKARCEERCKDEPHFGYVEREQRMDKCKEDCSGPTAVHNKCIKRCHSQFKPCKSRCHEIAYKFSCQSASPMKPVAPAAPEPPVKKVHTPKKSAKTTALLDDPEMI